MGRRGGDLATLTRRAEPAKGRLSPCDNPDPAPQGRDESRTSSAMSTASAQPPEGVVLRSRSGDLSVRAPAPTLGWQPSGAGCVPALGEEQPMSRKSFVVAAAGAALAVPLVAATPATAAEASSSVRARSYSGTVSSVIDGDSIRVRINGRSREVRLIGVAASSGRACYASQATTVRQVQASGRRVTLRTDPKHDQSDGSRLFAYVYVRAACSTSRRSGAATPRSGRTGPATGCARSSRPRSAQAKAHHVGSVGPLLTAAPGGHRVSSRGQQLGEVDRRGGRRAGRAGCGRRSRRPARRRPAGELAHGGQQLLLGDRHRDVVVAALHAPVAGQPAAAAEPGDASRRRRRSSAASADQPSTDVVVAVRLGDDLQPVQATAAPSPGVPVSSSASVRVPRRDPRGAPGRPSSSSASPRSTAVQDGSSPTTGTPASTSGARVAHRRAEDRPGGVELAGGDPGERRSRRRRPGPAPRSRRPRAPARRRRATSGAKWSVNESTHSATGAPPGRRRPRAARPTAAGSVRGANGGSVAPLVHAGRPLREPAAEPRRAARR